MLKFQQWTEDFSMREPAVFSFRHCISLSIFRMAAMFNSHVHLVTISRIHKIIFIPFIIFLIVICGLEYNKCNSNLKLHSIPEPKVIVLIEGLSQTKRYSNIFDETPFLFMLKFSQK